MLQTAGDAYKVLQLNSQNFPAMAAFHLMTHGNAEALSLAAEIGSLQEGCFADFVVLDSQARGLRLGGLIITKIRDVTPAMRHRMETIADGVGDLVKELFVLMTLGDDRAVRATFVQGHKVFDRTAMA